MTTSSKVQETLLRIREEAKQRVALALHKGKPLIPIAEPPVDVATVLREQVALATSKALSTKAAREYVGDLSERLQEIATDSIDFSLKEKFGGSVLDAEGAVVIYPNNCKLLIQNTEGRGSLVIEEPPQYRTVFYNQDSYRIALPYVVFLVAYYRVGNQFQFVTAGLGFRKQPISSIDDKLYFPKLPHTNGNQHVCQPMNKTTFNTVKELAEAVVNTFWNSIFHYDFESVQCQFTCNGEKIHSFKDWEKKIKNPLDILKANFQSGNSIRELLISTGAVHRTVIENSTQVKIQAAVSHVMNGVNSVFSADELAVIIQQTAEKIVNAALQNALQHEKTVV